jgi:hypothetical protein
MSGAEKKYIEMPYYVIFSTVGSWNKGTMKVFRIGRIQYLLNDLSYLS